MMRSGEKKGDLMSSWLLCLLAVTTALCGTARGECPCPFPPTYGPLPIYENITASLCTGVLYDVPADLPASLSQSIKLGCSALARTPLRTTLTRVSEFATTLQEVLNRTIVPNWQQGRGIKQQYDSTSDPAQKNAIEYKWSAIWNDTFNLTIGFSELLQGPYSGALTQLATDLEAVSVTDFPAAVNACGQVNRTYTTLEKTRQYYMDQLKNCTSAIICNDAKERIANLTKQMEAMMPSIKFCALFVPQLNQAFQAFRFLANGLSFLGSAIHAVGSQLAAVASDMRSSSSLGSSFFLLFYLAGMAGLGDVLPNLITSDVCVLITVPC